MIGFPSFRRRPYAAKIPGVYGAIVAQARLPAFYADYGVPDTLEGRFDMIVLHLSLLVRRLRSEPPEVQALGQGVFDAFCTDMDHSLREMGLSDVGVPRRMREFGEAFYGRAARYDRAIDATGDGDLVEALSRNVFATAADAPAGAVSLAAYVRDAEAALARQPASAIIEARIGFPTPAQPLSARNEDQR